MPGLIQPERQLTHSPTGEYIISIRVKSLFSDQWHEATLGEPGILTRDWDAWQSGAYIQNAMPYLSADLREFILTGATPDEWNAAFPEDED